MAITISADHQDVISWSYVETTTPTSPADTIVGGGALSLTIPYKHDGEFMQGDEIEFILPERKGSLRGWVRTSEYSGGNYLELEASLNIPTLMSALSVTRTIPLIMDSNLQTIITNYLGQVFRTPPPVKYIASNVKLYSFVGWEGDVWEALCSLAAMANVEIVTDGSQIIVRDIGMNVIEMPNMVAPSLSFDENNVGRYLDVTYTNQRKVQSVGGVLTNRATNPSLEVNDTGWSAVASPVSGVTSTTGRSSDWSSSGSLSYYQQQSMLDYKSGTLQINTPWVSIVGGQRLAISVAGYVMSHRIGSAYTGTFQARYELRNSVGTIIETGSTVSTTRGSRVLFNLPETPSGATSARIVLTRAWVWNG